MATIRTRKRGKTWSYSFEVGKNPETGRRRIKEKGGFATQDEAYDAGVEAYADWKHGNIGLTSDKVLLDDFFKIWLDKRRQPYTQKEGRPQDSPLRQIARCCYHVYIILTYALLLSKL